MKTIQFIHPTDFLISVLRKGQKHSLFILLHLKFQFRALLARTSTLILVNANSVDWANFSLPSGKQNA